MFFYRVKESSHKRLYTIWFHIIAHIGDKTGKRRKGMINTGVRIVIPPGDGEEIQARRSTRMPLRSS